MEIDTNKVVDKRELHLNACEKVVLQEFIVVFEPFEEATDIPQGDKCKSIMQFGNSMLPWPKRSSLTAQHKAQLTDF